MLRLGRGLRLDLGAVRGAPPRACPRPRARYAHSRPPPHHPHTRPGHHGGGHYDAFAEFPLEVPPLSQRLKPLIPFLIYWSAITSLAVHLLRLRKSAESELARAHAQESVLRGLQARFEAGEVVEDSEIRRELEMVGLRERTALTAHLDEELGELKPVSWLQVLLGRRAGKGDDAGEGEGEALVKTEEDGEDRAVEEWTKIVNEATTPTPAPEVKVEPARTGVVPRAKSSNVYL